ncbi:MAG: HEAT repeat domain-containing protein [Proteobacteria bacterium]|nr:HEAT repeat domain-containing protein [Pseudomonadota bacterium]
MRLSGFFPLICVCVLLCVLACAGATPQHVQVQNLFDRGDYRAAERAADHALARQPGDAALWRLKIIATLRTGDSARAVALYMKWHRLRRHYDGEALRAMAVSTLWRGLGDGSPGVRARAVRLSGRLGAGELSNAVRARLRDSSDRVAAAAAFALVTRHADAKTRALELLSSADSGARVDAIRALGRIGSADIWRHVEALSNDADPRVRRAAVMVLRQHRVPGRLSRLVHIARADSHGSVRTAALRALIGVERAIALSSGRRATADPYMGARLAGVALVAHWPDEHRSELAGLAASSDPYVALHAAVALRKAGGDAPVQAVQLALGQRSWTVRVTAVNLLAELLPRQTALSFATELLGDPRAEVRLASARVLVGMGQRDRAAEVIAQLLDSPRAEMRVRAAAALVRMGDERGYRAVTELSRSSRAATRQAAVQVHRHMDRPTLPLVSALGDRAIEVRIEAAAVLIALLERSR